MKKIKLRNLDSVSQSHYEKIKNKYSQKYKFFLDQHLNDIYIVTASGTIFLFKDLNFNSIQEINSNIRDF